MGWKQGALGLRTTSCATDPEMWNAPLLVPSAQLLLFEL